MDDDLYPNDGAYFGVPLEPLEQRIERKKEKALALEGMDFLKEFVSRLEERIDFYETNSSIPDEVRLDPKKFLILHNTYSLLAQTLTTEKEYLQDIIQAYKK